MPSILIIVLFTLENNQSINSFVNMPNRLFFVLFVFLNLSHALYAQKLDVLAELDYCHTQVLKSLDGLVGDDGLDYTKMPRNILSEELKNGIGIWNCRPSTPNEWCSGFWPGILWMDYSYSEDSIVRKHAQWYTNSLSYLADREPFDHDLGFLVFCSFGIGLKVSQNTSYNDIILRTAYQLSKLFRPRVGTILSWPREVENRGWPHNTIMDNMINLEMMFWAAKNGGDKELYEIAYTHAVTTMNNHFRTDGSSYHVAVYDSVNGNFLKGVTHQGYSDQSMWARGQAWAIYGFTMTYRETHEQRFLKHVEKVADIYLSRITERSTDYIPLWDFDDPSVEAPKDASAACIVASALLELSCYVQSDKSKRYIEAAEMMLYSLSNNYHGAPNCTAFLLHSVGNLPAGSEIDAAIIYADYYYFEALLRLKNLREGRDILSLKTHQ